MRVSVRNIEVTKTRDPRYPFAVSAEIYDIVNDADYVIRKTRTRRAAEKLASQWSRHGIKH